MAETSLETMLNAVILMSTDLNLKESEAGQEFSFEELEVEFKKHCQDYGKPISDDASKAVNFAAELLFKVGPQIRKEKKTKTCVKFVFHYVREGNDESQGSQSLHTVYVSTFKDKNYIGAKSEDSMVLTFIQAGLLATKIMNQVAEFLYNKNKRIIMTPLCRAIYSKEDIQAIALGVGMQVIDVIKMLNASCCSGGQHLIESNISCAMAAELRSTAKLPNQKIRDSILSIIFKQYKGKQKKFNRSEFKVFCKYALRGAPVGLDAQTLIEAFETTQTCFAYLQAAKASCESATTAKLGKEAETLDATTTVRTDSASQSTSKYVAQQMVQSGSSKGKSPDREGTVCQGLPESKKEDDQ